MLATWLARPPWTLCARTGVGGCEKESSAHHTCHLLLGGWTVQRVNVRRWLIYDIYIRFGSPVSCTLVSWRLSAKVSLAVRTERPRESSFSLCSSVCRQSTHSLIYFYLVCVCVSRALVVQFRGGGGVSTVECRVSVHSDVENPLFSIPYTRNTPTPTREDRRRWLEWRRVL